MFTFINSFRIYKHIIHFEDDKEIVNNLMIIFNNIMSKNPKDTIPKSNLTNIFMTISIRYHNEIRIIETLLKIINSISFDVEVITQLVDSGMF